MYNMLPYRSPEHGNTQINEQKKKDEQTIAKDEQLVMPNAVVIRDEQERRTT